MECSFWGGYFHFLHVFSLSFSFRAGMWGGSWGEGMHPGDGRALRVNKSWLLMMMWLGGNGLGYAAWSIPFSPHCT